MMRGIDTNVLVRLVTVDDPHQHSLAREFLDRCEEEGEEVHVTGAVLCELLWTISRGGYRYDRAQQADVIEGVLDAKVFVVENHDQVKAALQDFRAGRGDFPDYLIGRLNARAGARDTVTFDSHLEPAKGFTLLGEADYPPDAAPPSFVHEP
jgi:predicted nucleic-acid-binding protein